MHTLLIDNHDSYTYNLYQLIADVTGAAPVVLVNDDPRLARLDASAFGAAVISPGPGRPHLWRDMGHLTGFLDRADLPILGVCLGHQAIARAAGADVGSAPAPRHGHLTTVRQCLAGERGVTGEPGVAKEHGGDALLRGLPVEFTAVRYHSLCVRDPLPPALEATARAEDGVIMALRHRSLPRWGVQFHPESVATEFGRELLANFAALAGRRRPRESARLTAGPVTRPDPRPPVPAGGLRLTGRALRVRVGAEEMFTELFGSSASGFWLDSSLARPGLSRFSFLGDGSGPLSETLTYRVGEPGVTVTDPRGTRTEPGNMFDVLQRRLARRRLDADAIEGVGSGSGLPFAFTGGYVGYFGYEMKAECGASAPHRSPAPDSVWIFADRLLAVDHETGVTYLIAVHDGTGAGRAGAHEWVAGTARRLAGLAVRGGRPFPEALSGARPDPDAERRFLARHLVRDPDRYREDIAECQRQLRFGESYEICLTNRVRLPFHDSDLAFYKRLRRANPAPYAALLRAGDVTVLSSSPERFLRIDPGPRHQPWRHRRVESKPIKGTAPRHPDPELDAAIASLLAGDPKARAENLMIVDLLRNDLGRVCEIGSVAVTQYMAVESYATVHQLVSTVEGRLRPCVSAVECVRGCFPGGSMTGAPKLRTMDIIDRLETEARGVYSGALGYFGLGGGADLSIAIRTAVRQGGTLTVGAGGAIVLDSDPGDEYEEMMLKAAAPLRAYRAAEPRGAAA